MTIKEMHRALEALQASPSKSLGQNFLIDQNLARWIVSRLEIAPGDHVVEIGPGLGALTDVLAGTGAGLTLIEKDGRLAGYLRDRFASEKRIEVCHADATRFDTRLLIGRGPLKVIGNLPYYVSTPIIERFTDPLLAVGRAVFTLQRELAERLRAAPRTKDYGAMTVCIGRRWRVEYLRTLPASVFYPEPKVESAAVLFTPRAAADVPACDDRFFDRLVRACFGERRKQLRKFLGEFKASWPETAVRLGVQETARAEELSLAQWTALARLMAPYAAQNADEYFDVVDENDVVTESLPRGEVHARDLRHRAIHVLIFNQSGELFLQKRSMWKDRNLGLWDSSAAGHVDAGETYEAAAHRELGEEIGVDCELEPVARIGCSAETGWEFLQIYRARHDGPFTFAALEVEGGAFFSVEHVRGWLDRRPQDFTPIFRIAFPLVANGGAAEDAVTR